MREKVKEELSDLFVKIRPLVTATNILMSIITLVFLSFFSKNYVVNTEVVFTADMMFKVMIFVGIMAIVSFGNMYGNYKNSKMIKLLIKKDEENRELLEFIATEMSDNYKDLSSLGSFNQNAIFKILEELESIK